MKGFAFLMGRFAAPPLKWDADEADRLSVGPQKLIQINRSEMMVTSNAMSRKLTRLEEAQCFRDSIELRRQFRQTTLSEQSFEELQHASQIDDRELITELISFGFDKDTIAALTLLPLAKIAWASGEVTVQERMVATCCVMDSELIGNPAAVAMFQSWLRQRPDDELSRLWWLYTNQCAERMRLGLRIAIGKRLQSQATQIAEASGGCLGIGRICDAEQLILDQISQLYRLQ